MKIKMKNYARHLWLSLLLLVGATAIAVPELVETNGTIEISTVDQLKAFRDAVNSGNTYAGKTVKLTADLDLSSESNWKPIGNLVAYPGQSFDGVFDGQNHVIKNLTVNDNTSNYATAALFGSVEFGTIKNLTVKNVNITSTHYAAGIVAYTSNTPTIENCHVIGGTIKSTPEIVNGSYDNGDKAGGIMGYATAGSTINKCTVEGVTITGYRDLGGIVGYSAGNVTNNTAKNVTVTQDLTNGYKNPNPTTIGDIIGRDEGATLSNNKVIKSIVKVTDNAGNEAEYGDMKDAFDAINADPKESYTITLLKDATYTDAEQYRHAALAEGNTVTKNVIIDGAGHTLTFVGGGVRGFYTESTAAEKVTFQNMTIADNTRYEYQNGNNAWEFAYLEMGEAKTCPLEFTNVKFADGISVDGTKTTFTDCEFIADGNAKRTTPTDEYCMWINNGEVIVNNCTFTGYRAIKLHEEKDYGTEIGSVVIDGCTFKDLSKKPAVAIGRLNAETSVTITNNTIEGVQKGDQEMYLYESDTDLANFTNNLSGNTFNAKNEAELTVALNSGMFNKAVLQGDIALTENVTCVRNEGTFTLVQGEKTLTAGDYSIALNPGVTIKTDKRTDIFTSANSDYELVETAVSGGYTYSLLKKAIEPEAPEKPAVNPEFSVKIPTGTYQIKNNATGNYVNIVSKYYAKAEGTESTDYTKIGVGVGYKVADGYRVFSLTGKNPADNSEIEVYNYVAKAYTMAVKLVQEKITGRFSDNFSATTIDELNAFADSVCAIYIDDYAYLTLVPVSTDGTNYQVRAMATVPAIPNTVWTLGNSMIRGHVIDGHTCTDTWDWAKWQVYHYINTHSQMDATLQSMVKANLESIVPGTTYFLTAEEDGTLGYATTLTDATLWTMEPVETVEDGLTPDEYHIQNVGTEKFVNVTDTYYAKVDITEDDLIMEEIPATLINVDFGRSSKDNPNLYRITELSNGDKDVVAYVKKAVNKVKTLAANMTLNGTPLYEAMANKINELLGVQIAPADIKEDVELALDLCGEHYAYLNLVDNGDGTVSVYGDMPKVPALLDHAVKKLNLADDFLTWAKAQIDDYFATSGSNATLISLWNGNKDKIVPGQRYYLTSDNDDTFGFANNNSADDAKWMLTHVEKSFAELIDGVDYDVTLAGKKYKKMTYTRSFSATQKGKYQRWYIPADYTITEEDAENFEFYKIHMIAASNDEQGGVVTDNTKIYIYIEPLSSGTLKANRPYVVKPLKEMTDHVFKMQDVDLLAVDESPRLEVGVSEYLYDFYGTYDHFTYANAHEIFFLKNGSLHPNMSNAEMIPYMWYIKPKKNAINDDYAKVTFEFVEVETPTAITVLDANKSNEIEGYYSVNGIKQDGPQKGLNIVKYKNGQTKKVNIK